MIHMQKVAPDFNRMEMGDVRHRLVFNSASLAA
jgi:hypothetical protein